MLRKILNTNPRKRYSIEDIKTHPWFHITKPDPQKGFIVGESDIPIDMDIVESIANKDLSKF